MKNLARRGLSTALAASMVMGVSGSVESAPNISEKTLSAEQQAGYTQTFDEAKTYWSKRGVEGIENTRLEFVLGNAIGRCLLSESRSGDSTDYCGSEDKIRMTATYADISPTSLYGVFVMSHEVGHAVEEHTGVPLSESGANCLAGVFIADTKPDLLVASIFQDWSNNSQLTTVGWQGDGVHGTVAEQQESFAYGLSQRDCHKYGMAY